MTNSTGFAFVNITNPEEAKSVSNRRKVRQHVRYKKTSTDSKAAKVKQACETSPKQKRNAILEAGSSSQIILSLPEQGTRSDLMTLVRKQAQRRSRKGEKNIVQEELKIVDVTYCKPAEITSVILQTMNPVEVHVNLGNCASRLRMSSDSVYTISSFPIQMNSNSYLAVELSRSR